MTDAVESGYQNVSEVMLEFAPGSSEFSARWRHWFNFAVALYTAKTTVLPTCRQITGHQRSPVARAAWPALVTGPAAQNYCYLQTKHGFQLS